MADSNITVFGLVASGGPGQVQLAWNTPVDPNERGLPYLQLEAIEIWAGTTNNRDAASTVKIGEQLGANSFAHAGLTRGQRFYYWIKPRNRSGRYGDWHPLLATGGVVGQEANADFLAAANGYFQLPNGPLLQWGSVVMSFGSVIVTFPRPFTTRVFSFLPVMLDDGRHASIQLYDSLGDGYGEGARLVSVTVLAYERTDTGEIISPSGTVRWLAIGI